MSRPIKETTDWFTHSAKGNGIGSILENHFGLDGYVIWYKLQEKLAASQNHVIDISHNGSLELLAAGLRQRPETLVTVLDKAASLGGIDSQLWRHRIIWCQSLVDGLKPIYINRRRQLPQKPPVPRVARPPREATREREADRSCPYQKILELWKELVPSLPQPETPIDPSSARARAIRALWQQNPDLAMFRDIFAKVEASDFLSGRSGKWTLCSLDWVLEADHWQKIKEGNYDNRRTSNGRVRPRPEQEKSRPITRIRG